MTISTHYWPAPYLCCAHLHGPWAGAAVHIAAYGAEPPHEVGVGQAATIPGQWQAGG